MTKYLQHPFVLLIVTFLFVGVFISLRQTGAKTHQSSKEISELEKEAYQLSKEVQDLQEELEYSKSPEYKEKIIRDQLLMQKEGEYVVQVSAPEIVETDTEIKPQKTVSNQDRWLEILF